MLDPGSKLLGLQQEDSGSHVGKEAQRERCEHVTENAHLNTVKFTARDMTGQCDGHTHLPEVCPRPVMPCPHWPLSRSPWLQLHQGNRAEASSVEVPPWQLSVRALAEPAPPQGMSSALSTSTPACRLSVLGSVHPNRAEAMARCGFDESRRGFSRTCWSLLCLVLRTHCSRHVPI